MISFKTQNSSPIGIFWYKKQLKNFKNNLIFSKPFSRPKLTIINVFISTCIKETWLNFLNHYYRYDTVDVCDEVMELWNGATLSKTIFALIYILFLRWTFIIHVFTYYETGNLMMSIIGYWSCRNKCHFID